jgi:hypothetical protein
MGAADTVAAAALGAWTELIKSPDTVGCSDHVVWFGVITFGGVTSNVMVPEYPAIKTELLRDITRSLPDTLGVPVMRPTLPEVAAKVQSLEVIDGVVDVDSGTRTSAFGPHCEPAVP